MIKQIVYTKSINSDKTKDVFGLVKPANKEFVEFITKREGYFFTSEELKQLLEDYTNKIIDNAEIKLSKDWIRKKETINPECLVYPITIEIHKNSILKQLELIQKKLE